MWVRSTGDVLRITREAGMMHGSVSSPPEWLRQHGTRSYLAQSGERAAGISEPRSSFETGHLLAQALMRAARLGGYWLPREGRCQLQLHGRTVVHGAGGCKLASQIAMNDRDESRMNRMVVAGGSTSGHARCCVRPLIRRSRTTE